MTKKGNRAGFESTSTDIHSPPDIPVNGSLESQPRDRWGLNLGSSRLERRDEGAVLSERDRG
jgi:hypothetical protein